MLRQANGDSSDQAPRNVSATLLPKCVSPCRSRTFTIRSFTPRDAHEIYLRRYGNSPKRVLFIGMNPGPFGMAQTGVAPHSVKSPAGARSLGIHARIEVLHQDPERPVMGFELLAQRNQRPTFVGIVRKTLWLCRKVLRGTPGDELLPSRVCRGERTQSNAGKTAGDERATVRRV